MKNRKELVRKKLLSLLPRITLEDLAQGERPYMADRNELVNRILLRWPHDAIQWEIEKLLREAE